MSRTYRPILLALLLAFAFSASALHPYGHDVDTGETLDCQVCLHHAANPFTAGHPQLQLPEPAFRDAGAIVVARDRLTCAGLPTPRARGPPLSV
ncbi:hypothetical protein H0Z60_04365 [Ectothiorhodospiraceae bacterium WFHF3C12]|nr:hypothetical protein [Ectothiorhodospiraceae bacterium WFHF3C12]